jgi:hypothetical protein
MSFSFNELESANSEVIEILKTIPEFASVQIAVIGGLTLWKHLKEYPTTEVNPPFQKFYHANIAKFF